jgi:hypothetical protein
MNKEIKEFISEIILEFPNKIKNPSKVFKNFIAYFYYKLENKINSSKKISIKNKYIKIRKSALLYFIDNEKSITSEIINRKSIKQ